MPDETTRGAGHEHADATLPDASMPSAQTPLTGGRNGLVQAALRNVRRLPLVPLASLLGTLGIVLVTYWPALSAGALYMDDKFYLGAPLIRHPSWVSVKAIVSELLGPKVVFGYYQPLSLLSLTLDFLDPTAASNLLPFHRTALLLHLLNVALVVVLLFLLFNNWLTACLAGLLYGVHPLNADAILWIAERKTVLSTCFALSSLVLYVMYARHTGRTHRGDWKRYTASLFLYLCALLSKPTTLPLVGLMLILDYWPLGRLNRRALLEKVPFLLVCGLSAMVTVISQTRTGEEGPTQMLSLAVLPVVLGYSFTLYLLKTVWPTGLLSDYHYPYPLALSNTSLTASLIAAAVIILAVILSARRTRALLASTMFFFAAILPTLGIIRYTWSLAANRSMHLALLGFLLPVGWGMSRLWKAGIVKARVVGSRLVLAGVALIVATGSAAATRRYESHWHDSLTLLEYYLSQAPDDWRLHTRMGNEWIQRRDYQSAIAEFKEALRLNPSWTENHLNLGRALSTVGDYSAAREAFAVALRQAPNNWQAQMLMGFTLRHENDLEGARTAFQQATRLAPMRAVTHFQLAQTLAGQGKLDEATKEYRESLRVDPQFQDAQRALDALVSTMVEDQR